MGTTVAVLIASMRRLIPEAVAIDWLDASLLSYLQIEYSEWAGALGRLPGPGHFTMEATFTLPANQTAYALSGLVSPSAVGTFGAIKTLWYIPESGQETLVDTCAPGQESQWRLGVGESPVGQTAPYRRWMSRPAGVATLNLHPEANVDRDFRAYVRYLPPTLTLGASVQTEFRHDDVLVKGAVLRALLDIGETDPVIKQEYELAKIRFLDEERNAAGEFESETTKVVVSDAMFGSH